MSQGYFSHTTAQIQLTKVSIYMTQRAMQNFRTVKKNKNNVFVFRLNKNESIKDTSGSR